MGLSGPVNNMAPVSTIEVAKTVGVSKSTLERWLAEGSVKRPRPIRLGQRAFRLWTNQDIQRVKKYKKESYRKGRGRKPKAKQ
ncbi:MAG: MerR family transcriptional regulator [Chloroflexi bacterium]|nr:MerR family transcriptional regulator [Chloroflexota bacterium]